MTEYAHTTDKQVDRIGLPESLKLTNGDTVSNPAALDPEELAAEGWLPYVEVRPDLADGETWGTYTDVVTDVVTRTYTVIPSDPIAPPATDPLLFALAALRNPLANLTPTSTSTVVRTAVLNQRDALDALIAALAP